MNIEQLAEAARLHADNTRDEIKNASTRVQHIRQTALAVEADMVAQNLERLAKAASQPILLDFPTH